MSARVTSTPTAPAPGGRNIDRTSHTDEAVLDDLQPTSTRWNTRRVYG